MASIGMTSIGIAALRTMIPPGTEHYVLKEGDKIWVNIRTPDRTCVQAIRERVCMSTGQPA